jgi:RsiW-degrading membrane proteinase PrsW (M82 family)
MEPDFTVALSLALAITAVEVGALRVIDVHEKEPIWALLVLIWLGVVSAAVAALVVPEETRTETALGVAMISELAKFLAIAIGLVILALTDRMRGWSQVNGVVDSMIYGAAAGFGFTTGDAFLRETFASAAELQTPDPTTAPELLWMALQAGLSDALFGAILGAGLGVAFLDRGVLRRCLYPLAALALAVLAHLAYASAALEGSQVGPSASAVGVGAVLVVLALATLVFIRELRVESGAIVAELEREPPGTVTPEELELFRNPGRRRRAQARRFLAGDVEGLVYHRALENRQVQLALERRRARALGEAEERRALEGELERLRAAIERQRRAERARQARLAGASDSASEPPGTVVAIEPRAPASRMRRLGGVFAAAAFLVAGGTLIAIAAGAEPPTATYTRSALFEREQAALNEDVSPSAMRLKIRPVVGVWRLDAAHANVGLIETADPRAQEAYDLAYADAAGNDVRLTVARYSSSSEAELMRERLTETPPEDAERWVQANGETLTMLIGASEDVAEFCAANPPLGVCGVLEPAPGDPQGDVA